MLWDGQTADIIDGVVYSVGGTVGGDVQGGNPRQGAIVGNVMSVEKLTPTGRELHSSITFPADIEDGMLANVRGQPVVTAIDLNNRSRLYYHVGLTGTATEYVDLPYAETYRYREVRDIGQNKLAIAYRGNVGGTSNVLVVGHISDSILAP